MRRTILVALAAICAGTMVFFAEALFSPVTMAVPAFARKTGLACSACHEVWPRLNDFGQLFRDNGYRLKRDRDAPVEQDPSYWPIAMRTTVGYQWLRQTLVATDAGPVTTQTGTFGFSGLDVFAAGTLGDNYSFLITYTPGLAQSGFQTAPSNTDSDLESAFFGIHDIAGTTYLNVRIGKHAPDLPIDEHRTITLTQGYNVYHYHPDGSAVTWEPGNNQNGIEIYGHSELSRFRYSVSLLNENDAAIFSNSALSNPVVWGHVTGESVMNAGPLAAVKVGVFGSIGWHSSAASTLTTPPPGGSGNPEPVPGTGSAAKNHYRYGAEAHLYLLNYVNPLTITGVLWGGSDDQALVANASGAAKFIGGFVEGVYTITPRLSLIGRYEMIHPTQTADAAALGVTSLTGNVTSWTAAIRHTFELTSRTEAALHLEFSRFAQDAGDGTTPETLAGLAGIDMAF